MSHLTNIIRKELKELITPGAVLSVLVMVLLFSMLGGLLGGEVDKAQTLPKIGLSGSENGILTIEDEGVDWNIYDALSDIYGDSIPSGKTMDDYIILLNDHDVDGNVDYTSLQKEMSEHGLTCAMVVPDDFGDRISKLERASLVQFYIYEPEGLFTSVASSIIPTIASMLNTDLSKALLKEPTDGDSEFYINPISYKGDNTCTMVNGKVFTNMSPSSISSQISSQTMIIPIIIMIIVVLVGSLVISSIGSEKENKTLETLLTLPIKRTTIVTGKIIASALMGLLYGFAYMIGMGMYMGSLTVGMASGVNLADLGLSLNGFDYILVMLSLFLSIVCALGLCMILGGFAKNYKSAQTMTMPLSILAMIPMFIIMFTGWEGASPVVQALLFVIPFSHPMMAMEALMYGNMGLVVAGIVYMAIFSLTTIMITVKLYNSDILLTGLGQNKTYQKLMGKK